MKYAEIDVGQKFENIVTGDGSVMKDEAGKEMTAGQALKFAVANELKSDSEGDPATVVERRIKHHALLNDIHEAMKNNKTLILLEEDAKYLEHRIAQTFNTLIAGPLISCLRSLKEHKIQPAVSQDQSQQGVSVPK